MGLSDSEKDTDVSVSLPQAAPPHLCFGRRPIYTDVDEITPDNILQVLSDVLTVHNDNRADIQYLYDVYKGRQDILGRTKQVRPEICNYVVINRSNEIVSFKTSYLMGEPVQYVSSASARGDITSRLTRLNEYMRMEGKAGKDVSLANWFHICGVGYRLVLPDSRVKDPNGSPFNVYILDPRDTFVIRYAGVDHRPLAGVNIVHYLDKPDVLCIYTPRWYMEVPNLVDGVIPAPIRAERVNYADVPIVEYAHNQVRMGAFEPVLSQLNEINVVESNRIDAIEQTVQALTVFENCDFTADDYDQMRVRGAVKIKSNTGIQAKVYAVKNELEQTGVQQTLDDLQASIYDICGMPSTQNGGASTSDTGSAVIMRDGWQQAEARAKETENYFALAEQQFLRVVLDICRTAGDLDIGLDEVQFQFTRRNYSDLLTKSQVLTTLLSSPKINPKLAFEACTLFTDPDAAYQLSLPYIQKAEAAAEQAAQTDNDTSGNPDAGGSRSGQPGENGSPGTE